MSILRPLVTALLTGFAIAHLRAQAVQIVGVYSTLRSDQQSGDLLGTEIIVSKVGGAHEVSFQEAEGAPTQARRVPAIVKGDSLFFTLPPDTLQVWQGNRVSGIQVKPGRTFRGRISPAGLRGRFVDEIADRIMPRRQRSYWSK